VKLLILLTLVMLAACGRSGTDTAADQTTASAPPAVRYDEYVSAGDVLPPGETPVNPFANDPGAIQQGEALFGAMNCDGCHGGGGIGFVGPSLVDGRWRYGGDDGALYQSIFYGRPHGMPAYGGLLSDTTVWQLVSYVRSQPVPDIVPTIAWP